MAGIDKTYTNSFKEYKEFKDWADKQKLTFFDGLSVCICCDGNMNSQPECTGESPARVTNDLQ